MDLKKLNAATKYLPSKKLSELNPGQEYLVTKIRKVNTQFGYRLVLELDEGMSVFLPKRSVEAFEQKMQHIQGSVKLKKLKIYFLGDGPYENNYEVTNA